MPCMPCTCRGCACTCSAHAVVVELHMHLCCGARRPADATPRKAATLCTRGCSSVCTSRWCARDAVEGPVGLDLMPDYIAQRDGRQRVVPGRARGGGISDLEPVSERHRSLSSSPTRRRRSSWAQRAAPSKRVDLWSGGRPRGPYAIIWAAVSLGLLTHALSAWLAHPPCAHVCRGPTACGTRSRSLQATATGSARGTRWGRGHKTAASACIEPQPLHVPGYRLVALTAQNRSFACTGSQTRVRRVAAANTQGRGL